MNKQAPDRKTLALLNASSECTKLHESLMAFAQTHAIPDEICNDLRLAVEETFINAINYAYQDNKPHTITVEFSDAGDKIAITFTDSGTAFNPLTDYGEMPTESDHCEGGMGIHIIKSLTDYQEYHRINQHNVFTITKLYTKKK